MLLALIAALLGQPMNERITVGNDVTGQMSAGFFGVHYDGPRHKYWNPVPKRSSQRGAHSLLLRGEAV